MSNYSDRRDFLKVLIGGTGAAFLALHGCGDDTSKIQRVAGPNPETILKRQRFSLAHQYVRDKSIIGAKNNNESMQCDVVIIGAGASGLAAALTLHDAGFDVLLLENESQVGGAGIHGNMHDIKYPYGSVYFVDYSDDIKKICARTGLQPLPAPEDAVLHQGELIGNFWSDASLQSLEISQIEKDGMKRFRDVLLNDQKVPSYPLPRKLSQYESELDAQSAKEYLSQYSSPYLETLLDLYSRSSMGGTLKESNAYCLLNFYSSEIGSEFGKDRFTFPGGMNALYKAIASLIPQEKVMTNHLAFAIENTKDGVEVSCVNDVNEIRIVKAKKVIMTGQKHVSSFMIQDLSDAQRSAMMSMQYPPYATMHFTCEEELFPNHIMDVWTPEATPFCTDIICSNAMQGTKKKYDHHVYSIFGAMPQQQRSVLMDDQAMAKHGVDIISKTMKYLGKSLDSISQIEVFGWGHALAIPFPGSHNGPAQLASARHGNMYFGASDNDAASSVENALANGFASGREVIQSLN
jgi:protoporphyrinogen oxidase